MFTVECHPCSWRPVFDAEGHMVDIFSEAELSRIGGGEILQKNFQQHELYANIVVVPKSVASALEGQSVVAVLHSAAETEETHKIYQRLELKREAILIVK